MGKTAIVFPGQGAQYVGMGKEFYEKYPVCREVMQRASQVTGLDIPKLCFEENQELNITEYTQIAMVAVEAAMLKAAQEEGLQADVYAGLSLGEYTALIGAGVLSLDDAFAVVRQRGIFMQEAVPQGGAMTAVLGLAGEMIESVCQGVPGPVWVANYNCPGQVVITGMEEAVKEAESKLKEAGARRCLPLKVSGPFHSPLLQPAAEKLKGVLNEIFVGQIQVPYVTNVTGDYVEDSSQVKELLAKQVASSVRWQQGVEAMAAQGVDTFIEIGPGKTLSGFLRKIDKSLKGYHIETPQDLEQVLAELKGEN
ncbi:MAG TPA: ACP S-malonyltransferase [Candidatus Egerieimonas intestinavium]|uniref:Malonyl CoA-acyl carrier protein transacylase n=1 Tax=Candidatus Egerieimonas intestinavium TaxID=2840777 RepID=A0A9D1EKW3_9FIRM|nr:ACP S-malonyltransferase [Candidatus Egerieimonas intestinavium]